MAKSHFVDTLGRKLGEVRRYFGLSLLSPDTARKRLLQHGTMTLFIVAGLFALNVFYAVATLPGLAICVLCAVWSGVIIGASLYLMDEWLAPRALGKWGALAARSVGKTWVIWGVGFILSGLVIQGLDPFIHRLLKGFLHQNAITVPGFSGPLDFVARALPVWGFATFFIIQIRLGRQLDRELDQLNRLGPMQRGGATGAGPGLSKLVVTTQAGTNALDPSAISHISVEEHYSNIHTSANGEFARHYAKLSLKQAMAQLPADLFLQVHRSHIVNMAYVTGIERISGRCVLSLMDGRAKVPVSRQRARRVVLGLKEFWARTGAT